MAVLMPTTSPAADTSGPPELPGLSAASVWMTSSIRRPLRDRSDRPSAETTPAVTVDSKPSGLPIATTRCPRFSVFELPSVAAGVPRGSAARSSARSMSGSSPSTSACVSPPSANFEPHAPRAADHMAVGQHQAVAGDDDAGAGPAAAVALGGLDAHHRRPDAVGDAGDDARIGVERGFRSPLGLRVLVRDGWFRRRAWEPSEMDDAQPAPHARRRRCGRSRRACRAASRRGTSRCGRRCRAAARSSCWTRPRRSAPALRARARVSGASSSAGAGAPGSVTATSAGSPAAASRRPGTSASSAASRRRAPRRRPQRDDDRVVFAVSAQAAGLSPMVSFDFDRLAAPPQRQRDD